ncbi:MAG TPA: S1/P1 nuclease, partial [Verrucomicrobiae bacterium]
WAWSAPGHEAVALGALQLLHGTPAAAKINAILDGEDPADAAIWLDRVRENYTFPSAVGQAEARNFRHNFPQHETWHFSNFPVGSHEYRTTSAYASTNDVVQALETAIAVLEGKSSRMTSREALRTVFHLAGDIHQPLHCVTGYYDLQDPAHPRLVSTPKDPDKTPEDRGGNQLYYTKTAELHALFDKTIPARVGRSLEALTKAITPRKLARQPITPGDYHHWPEQWAGESMTAGQTIYQDIRAFTGSEYADDRRHEGKEKLVIHIDLPKSFSADHELMVHDQLEKATIHLAQLLQRIQFASPP